MALVSKTRSWIGRGLSGLIILFLAFDAITKVMRVPQVLAATAELGYPFAFTARIGALLLALTCLYAIPRTARVGALLLTAYLGGAVASQIRIGAPLWSVAFPILFAILLWAGLLLRDPNGALIFAATE